jgi:predicted GNAT superfamily acetyltransferase
MTAPVIRLLDRPEEMPAVEELQRIVWPGSETDVIPAHLLLASVRAGGLLLGAFLDERLAGAVYGFPALERTPDGPRPLHHSHILAVHPDFRDAGLGFALKRAQWQLVRAQGLDRVTWTYDPLLGRNAHLNIARLGAVCNKYHRSEYGEMRDGLNAGLPTDRFLVDWWIRTPRVERRLQRNPRARLGPDHFLSAGAQPLYEPQRDADGRPLPPGRFDSPAGPLALVEIPFDFQSLRGEDIELAREWRLFSREVFESVFARGYLVTDFVHEPDAPRGLYVLAHGDSVLE